MIAMGKGDLNQSTITSHVPMRLVSSMVRPERVISHPGEPGRMQLVKRSASSSAHIVGGRSTAVPEPPMKALICQRNSSTALSGSCATVHGLDRLPIQRV